MSKQQYTWLLAVSLIARHQIGTTINPEGPGATWANITARAGQLQNPSAPSANDADLAAALLILGVIYLWNRAIYRARLTINAQKQGIYFQNEKSAFLNPNPAEIRAVQRLHETTAFFWSPIRPCQMNSPLTVSHMAR